MSPNNNAPNTIIAELRNATIYQRSQVILNEVNFKIHTGEMVYLIGKTGTGKSSLLKTLYAELELLNGEGVVAGFDLRQITWRHIPLLRRQLGIIFQDFNLMQDRSIEENLRFVLQATGWKDAKQINLRIQDVLEKVGIKSKMQKRPHELSGGEQQRAAIARALLNNPVLILADEPTGNLDPETSDEILLLLHRFSKELGTAIVLATHDYMLLEKFPARTVRCAGGRLSTEQSFTL